MVSIEIRLTIPFTILTLLKNQQALIWMRLASYTPQKRCPAPSKQLTKEWSNFSMEPLPQYLSLELSPSEERSTWQARALKRQDTLTKPPGSLGVLESLAVQLSAIQLVDQPRVDQAQAIIFAADHPAAQHGTSAFPTEVTAAMVGNFLAGGAASSVLAQIHGIPLMVIDVGVDTPYPLPQVSPDRFQRYEVSAGDITTEAALSREEFKRTIEIGRQCIADLPQSTNLLILGEMGIGNTTPSSALASALLEEDIEGLVGRGTGVDEEGFKRKTNVIRTVLERWTHVELEGSHRVAEAVRQLGGREMSAVLGAMLEAVQRDIPILVDGFIISAVALALVKMHPEARHCLIFSHRSQERGHQRILAALQGDPLLSLDLRLGEASGALTAYPLLRAACALHNQMATFEEAAVPNRDDLV